MADEFYVRRRKFNLQSGNRNNKLELRAVANRCVLDV